MRKAAPKTLDSTAEATGETPCATGVRWRKQDAVHSSRAPPNSTNTVPAKTAGPVSVPPIAFMRAILVTSRHLQAEPGPHPGERRVNGHPIMHISARSPLSSEPVEAS